jgi:hypothetical protein
MKLIVFQSILFGAPPARSPERRWATSLLGGTLCACFDIGIFGTTRMRPISPAFLRDSIAAFESMGRSQSGTTGNNRFYEALDG